MKDFLKIYIFSNIFEEGSLDIKFYLDIFFLSKIKLNCYSNLFFTSQQLAEFIVLNSYFLISLSGIGYIIFRLLLNMFSYSI